MPSTQHTRTCKNDSCTTEFQCKPSSKKVYCSRTCSRKIWTFSRLKYVREHRDTMNIREMAEHFGVETSLFRKAMSDYRRIDKTFPKLYKVVPGTSRISVSGYGVTYKYTKNADGTWSREKVGTDLRRKEKKPVEVKPKVVNPVQVKKDKPAPVKNQRPVKPMREPKPAPKPTRIVAEPFDPNKHMYIPHPLACINPSFKGALKQVNKAS